MIRGPMDETMQVNTAYHFASNGQLGSSAPLSGDAREDGLIVLLFPNLSLTRVMMWALGRASTYGGMILVIL